VAHYSLPQRQVGDDSEMKAQDRKGYPLATGLLDFFPDALAEVARLSLVGGQKHHPGEPLHWLREDPSGNPDSLMRHLVDRGKVDTDGVPHSAKVAWRALAILQLELEASLESSCESDESLVVAGKASASR
jgi:Domain of unknown function (DUF5664)